MDARSVRTFYKFYGLIVGGFLAFALLAASLQRSVETPAQPARDSVAQGK
jgi:hypothetical protein